MATLFFLGIGVARPRGMAELPGVEQSIEAMREWAEGQGYVSLTVTDAAEPVTAERIADKLETILHERVDRIVVYFVGHGFLAYPDQIWILSDGPEVNTGRVSRDTLRGSICTYRPRQVAIISDTCLESRHFATGTVPVLRDQQGPRQRVFVDGFYSTLPNAPAFAFRRNGEVEREAFCLFTSVLVDFLKGDDPRAFHLASGMSEHVTTQTLYFSLPDAVLERGAHLNVDQEPRIEPGFPQGDDIYTRFNTSDSIDKGDRDSTGPRDDSKHRDWIAAEIQRPAIDTTMPLLNEGILKTLVKEAHDWGDDLAALVHHTGPRASWGFIVNEQPTGFFVSPIPSSDGYWCPILRGDFDEAVPYVGRRPRSLLMIQWYPKDMYFTMLPVFEKLIATVQLHNGDPEAVSGCTHVSWTPNYHLNSYSALTTEAWNAVALLLRGKLTSKDALILADNLRAGKHANPMRGVVCAYLYDFVGDTDSISRLCHFYVEHGQGIPFDIALLSGGDIRTSDESQGWEVSYAKVEVDRIRESQGVADYLWCETPGGIGRVAGAVPLLRAGWSRLAAHRHPLLREFATLEGSLSQSPIATLIGEEAHSSAISLLKKLKFITV